MVSGDTENALQALRAIRARRLSRDTGRQHLHPRAGVELLVKRIPRKYGYPPDKQEKATLTVLGPAEVLSANWTAE